MEIKSSKPVLRFAPAKAGFAFVGLLPLLVAVHAQAVEFSFADNEITGSIDSTVSYGQLWRVQGQDKSNNDINTNDGNRNFDTGLVSEVFKITTDMEARYQNYGVFVRGTASYDTQIMDKRNSYYDTSLAYQPSQNVPNDDSFTSDTRNIAGRNAEILDAYVYGYWDIGDTPLGVRLGKQVFNWGEGLYYRGGVNTTNPVDAAKFRLPGAEVKEVLIPVEALSFNLGLTDNLSMEAFYQWNWKETAVDPVGTYFSETDLFAEGGSTAYTSSDSFANSSLESVYNSLVSGGILQGTDYYDSDSGTIKVANVGSDINAKNDGQFGFNFKYIAEELNSTEFGLYFVNYHSKEPTIYANLNEDYGFDSDDICVAIAGFNCATLTAFGATDALAAASGVAAIDTANQVNARREYAEDIRMYGFSFNTTVANASVFGELAYRPNLPIGVATTNDLLGDLLSQALTLGSGGVTNIGGQYITSGDEIHNSERVEAYNASLGTIYNFGPTAGFDSLFGVFELSSEHLRGSDLTYVAYDGTTRYYSGRGNSSYVSGGDRDDQVNKNAYGYTMVLSGTWNDVYAGVNVSPYVVYKDDFEGNSYQTGNFIDGRKAYTLGVKASYLNSLEGELAYTEYYGGGQNNGIRDRDNIGVNVKYSF